MSKSATFMLGLAAAVALSLPAWGQGTAAAGAGLNPATLTTTLAKPATTEWATFAGDYSQRRFSPLTQINRNTVAGLTLAWKSQALVAGPGNTGGTGGRAAFGGGFGRRGGGGRGANYPTYVDGIADPTAVVAGSSEGSPRISGSILQVNGILYISSPDNAWAMDAHDGTILWHFWWRTRGGDHIGNRGMAMYGDWLYFEVPDDYLISLDAKTGKERWHKEISDYDATYFSTMAPVVIGNHVMVGTSNNNDEPGFLQAFDPVTGDVQWKTYLVPMAKGDPGYDTWANLDSAQHGGATSWLPGSYDPETGLYIFGTGNPIPAYSVLYRGPGTKDVALFTCSVIAVHVDTGKMAWYYQTSPDDTHDWDSVEAPVMVDGTWDGKPRHLVLQAARNGYFFVIDRDTGQHLLTSKYSVAANWAFPLNSSGTVERNPEKDNTVAGSLVSSTNTGATNWPPPSYDPQTGLDYVPLHEAFAMYYLTLKDPRLIMGLGGSEQDSVGSLGNFIAGIDYHTGKTVYKYKFPGSGGPTGLLTTAGGLLFSGDGAGNLVAYDVSTPKPLWHSPAGTVSNAPETYMMDGTQYVLAAVGDQICAFRIQR